jgi:DNA-directed RNA polymerase subunit RPC12/RpoP
MKHNRIDDKFYCPKCKISFSTMNENGKAKCPICKHTREDNFNQLSANAFKCLTCKAVFTKNPEQEITCQNCSIKMKKEMQ